MSKKARIVGLGCMGKKETCIYCGGNATLYVSTDDDLDMQPACSKCLGPGSIGELVEVKQAAVSELIEALERLVDKCNDFEAFCVDYCGLCVTDEDEGACAQCELTTARELLDRLKEAK